VSSCSKIAKPKVKKLIMKKKKIFKFFFGFVDEFIWKISSKNLSEIREPSTLPIFIFLRHALKWSKLEWLKNNVIGPRILDLRFDVQKTWFEPPQQHGLWNFGRRKCWYEKYWGPFVKSDTHLTEIHPSTQGPRDHDHCLYCSIDQSLIPAMEWIPKILRFLPVQGILKP
jgi:hypothetical protein